MSAASDEASSVRPGGLSRGPSRSVRNRLRCSFALRHVWPKPRDAMRVGPAASARLGGAIHVTTTEVASAAAHFFRIEDPMMCIPPLRESNSCDQLHEKL